MAEPLQSITFNPPLEIGSQFYHTLTQLTNEFGMKLTDVPDPKTYLIPYFQMGNQRPVEPEHIKKLKEFFTKRIDALENTSHLDTNNSLKGNRKRTILTDLRTVVKNLGVDPSPTDKDAPNLVNKEDIVFQLFKSAWLIANRKPDADGKVDAGQQWDDLVKVLKKMAPDEAIQTVTEATLKNKSKKNSLTPYVTSTGAATGTPKSINILKKSKQNIIKLFTLFRTKQILSDEKINKQTDEQLDILLKEITDQENPNIARNIRLSYLSIIRFYRDQYLRVMQFMGDFMKAINPAAQDTSISVYRYPIDPMVRIVYIMNELERFVNKDSIDPKNNFFPNNEGIIRLNNDTQPTAYGWVVELVKKYKDHIKTQPLKNTVDPTGSKDDLNYQLIDMHTSSGPPKGILQLVCGADIEYNREALDAHITELSGRFSSTNDFRKLRKVFDDFFVNKDKTLYIIYQLSPINLLKNKDTKIKQLNDLECLLAKVHSLALNDEGSTPKIEDSDDKDNLLLLISNTKRAKPKDKIDNSFAKFGITIKENPYQLVQSITQLIGSILNISYLHTGTKFRETTKYIEAARVAKSGSTSAAPSTAASS